MKNLLKSLIIVALIALGTNAKAAVLSTNVTSNYQVHLLSTNGASVYNVQFVTSVGAATINLYDADIVTAPLYGTNYTNLSFVSRASFTTNLVTSFTNAQGFTNFFTNAGIWSYLVTNAASTNALTPLASFVVANGVVATYNTDLLFRRGITMLASTNVSVVINYNSGR